MNSANPPADDSQNQQPLKDEIDFEEKYLRTLAELENFRKKVERERTDFAKLANENALTTLLPILDNFKRASEHLPSDLKDNEWVKGVAEIEKQFEQTLESLGLQRIEVMAGDTCDAMKHEAIATGEGESGKILEVVEEGYELNGKILRASKVRVGK
ncbi:nucleotide exchange factor GrpE [Candidatus Gracilibacteria bacterium]|nr:nucleotide exchange factor GrpE [Candidatus Gracilibacteria bacterium]